jgi:hypothetical protein
LWRKHGWDVRFRHASSSIRVRCSRCSGRPFCPLCPFSPFSPFSPCSSWCSSMHATITYVGPVNRRGSRRRRAPPASGATKPRDFAIEAARNRNRSRATLHSRIQLHSSHEPGGRERSTLYCAREVRPVALAYRSRVLRLLRSRIAPVALAYCACRAHVLRLSRSRIAPVALAYRAYCARVLRSRRHCSY